MGRRIREFDVGLELSHFIRQIEIQPRETGRVSYRGHDKLLVNQMMLSAPLLTLEELKVRNL